MLEVKTFRRQAWWWGLLLVLLATLPWLPSSIAWAEDRASTRASGETS